MRTVVNLALLMIILSLNLICEPKLALTIIDGDINNGFNPDSVLVDTCSSSSTFNKFYGKKIFYCAADTYFFKDIPIPYNEERTWRDIDSSFISTIQSLQLIESEFGNFVFKRWAEALNDSFHLMNKSFIVIFENYVPIDSIITKFTTIQHFKIFGFYRYPQYLPSIPLDKAVIPRTKASDIVRVLSQNDDHIENYPLDKHKLGYNWNIYSLKLPMAWEISKGKNSTVICAGSNNSDQFYPQGQGHSDIIDNFFQCDGTNDNSLKDGHGNQAKSDRMRMIHGLQTISCAVSKSNNGALNPMVGTCPDCNIINIANNYDNNISVPRPMPEIYDVDKVNDNILTMPDVFFCSEDRSSINRTIVDYGIPYVIAAGNQRWKFGDISNVNNDKICNPADWYGTGNEISMYLDHSDGINSEINSQKDVKPICVGGTQDGVQYYPNSSISVTGEPATANWSGDETFIWFFNFSRYINKFPKRPANITDTVWKFSRLKDKTNAYVDVVAPAQRILLADADAPGYSLTGGGTSQSGPMVAGIIGLMLTVNKFMHLPLINNPTSNKDVRRWMPDKSQSDPADVHRKIYNIITFTADKIYDQIRGTFSWDEGNTHVILPGDFSYYPAPYNSNDSFQYDYVKQENDKLKRWWAQRMGFGRVNAFRSVAHSISNKGDYEFTESKILPFSEKDQSGDSRGYVNEQNQQLMHFGSHVKLGNGNFEVPIDRVVKIDENGDLTTTVEGITEQIVDVVDWGGTSLPTDPVEYNNQGVTKLNNSFNPITLTVPDNSILAIDGLLISEQPNENHIINTLPNSDGKILITGYTKDVNLQGFIKVSDLVLESTGENGRIDFSYNTQNQSELYGKLRLLNNANIYIYGTQPLLMNPGSSIILDGNNDLVLEDGNTISMKSATEISSDLRKIIVKQGATLIVEANTNVRLILPVEVQNGGSLIIEPNSEVMIKSFKIASGGTFSVGEGCIVRLIETQSYCDGDLSLNGSSTKPITVASIGESQTKYGWFDICKNFTQIICNGHAFDVNVFPPPIPGMLKAQYVNFVNVAVKSSNNLLQPFISCNFSTNTTELYANNPTIKKPNNFLEIASRGIANLEIQNCSFKDNGHQTLSTSNYNWLTADNTTLSPPDFDFHISGIHARGFFNVDLTGCEFKGLNSGIETVICGRVTLTSNNFSICRLGQADNSSSVKLCQNVFNRVNTPQSLNNSKYWVTAENNFNQSNKSANLIGVLSGQKFSTNQFQDFYNGVYTENSTCVMRSENDPFDVNEMIVGGTNSFEIPDPSNNNNDYTLFPLNNNNPFAASGIGKFNIPERSDFFLYHSGANLRIDYGFNTMSEFTPNHVYYKKEFTTDPNKDINLNYNDWKNPPSPAHFLRLYQVNAINTTTIDVFPISFPQCNPLVLPTTIPYTQDYDPCNYFSRNTGGWAYLSSADTVLDNEFYAYLNDFCNGILSCECYKKRLFDLIQLVTLGDSTDAKLEMIINCVTSKFTDPAYTFLNCDVTNLLLQLGESYERRGLAEDALNIYYNILTNSHNHSDSTLARWRVMNLEAMQADSTFGSVYDSLMSAYYKRIDRDITATQHGTVPPPIGRFAIDDTDNQNPEEKNQEVLPLAVLEQNAPNPFNNETMITFYLNREADVRLGIHDALGKTVKEVVNQRLKKGKYVYTFQNENLMTGVYLYLLTTDGKQVMKKMQLVK